MALYVLNKIPTIKMCKHLCCKGYYSTKPLLTQLDYKKCYQVLEIPEDSDQEHIRQAYITLVKKYHPDRGEGNDDKFKEIDVAFKTLMDKKSKERWDVEIDESPDAQEYDIKHTAPQHRQFLSYEGIGTGTVFQREKQYSKLKAMQAAVNVLSHRMQKAAAEEKALMQKSSLKHKIKTKYGYERLVEDLIQEAISKGQFSNLSGSGKPLKNIHDKNPYVDFVTHKINEILIENGFTPEWITLQKEIRQDMGVLKDSLLMERKQIGPIPLSNDDKYIWSDVVERHRILVDAINKKITKYNLVVPVLTKQMFLIDILKESEKILETGLNNTQVPPENHQNDSSNLQNDTSSLFGFIDSLFNKK
ncbi:dnaJ homolog subfamily C member 28 [Onthophagus taurus]|uniref:dnaJ homolog subfamily C member 28 n=1 Tax=Onthophagus taurus TaxID=166361 RepID=UPI000C204DE6|nr:dnaJ homolog subfamily C member 28 [Onthophagus taurus]XP_022916996.1 dnaJ homolog subfamily C member 28 [Onthophagus taurus]XP_022916997.1 dnaJ homolog subfamily C member 28 [Onthophagus taurus]